jgi:hypothetical protein
VETAYEWGIATLLSKLLSVEGLTLKQVCNDFVLIGFVRRQKSEQTVIVCSA